MPVAGDEAAVGRQIIVEHLRERQSGMGASVDITADLAPLADNETMKASGVQRDHEIACGTVGDRPHCAKPDAGRG